MHFETRDAKTPFMYIFAEPVTEEEADEIQNAGEVAQKHFARTVVGVGKDDPEVQAAWQNIQDEVDEQVDVDKDGKLSSEKVEDQAAETESVEDSTEAPSTEDAKSEGVASAQKEETTSVEMKSDGPLMGWTLTVRSKVNGNYVDRPRKFNNDDEWVVEYHVQEIPETSRWRLYNALRTRRRGLIGMEDQEVDKGLQSYRNLIQRFSNRGREWRKEQDKINEDLGIQVYKPLGPGSEDEVPAIEFVKDAPAIEPLKEASAVEPVTEAPATGSTKEAPVVEIVQEAPAIESIEKAPAVESTEEAPAVESVKEVPDAESAKEVPDVDPTKEVPDAESVKEAPAVKSVQEAPDVEPVKEDPVTEPPPKRKSWFGF